MTEPEWALDVPEAGGEDPSHRPGGDGCPYRGLDSPGGGLHVPGAGVGTAELRLPWDGQWQSTPCTGARHEAQRFSRGF